MVSQKPRDRTELPQSAVPEEERFAPAPTLIVLWGRNGEAMNSLKASVMHRLAAYTETGALEWAGPFSSEIKGEELAQACRPLLSWDLWQRLVEKGYWPGLPERDSPARIQVIFVVDRMTGDPDDPPLKVMEEARNLLGERINLTPLLVWLGRKPEPPPEDINLYWPRIRMEPVAAGGMEVKPQLVWKATEHLLVALVNSAFIPATNRIVDEGKAEWLVVGASALLLHPDVEEWLREAILKEVLDSLIASLPEAEIGRIEEKMSESARKIREALLEEAAATLKEIGWQIPTDGPAVQQCILSNDALLEALFGPYRGGVIAQGGKTKPPRWKEWFQQHRALIAALAEPFVPDQRLGETLYQHYRELSGRIEQWLSIGRWRGLAPRALEEYQRLSVLLGALLDRGLMSRISSEEQPSWWFTERPLPTGLPAILMALLALEKHLSEEGDVKDARRASQEWVRPEPMNAETYLRAAGETDAAMVRGNLLRYAHFARTIASPWGILLYLLPAWPLAVFLVQSFLRWELPQTIMVTGLALLVVGIGELIYWWLIKARRLLKAVQRAAYHSLTSRILRLIAGGIRDYRHWILSRLREAELALVDLYDACLCRYAETEKALQALKEPHPYISGNTYILVNKDEVQKWREQAKKKAIHHSLELEGEIDESAITALIVQKVWPLPEQPTPGGIVVRELEARCAEAIQESKPKEWDASLAAESIDELKEGRRWEWLWRHAHPLGRTESSGAGFTFVMAPEVYLYGSTGRGSQYWRQEWQTVATLLKQEEICIRVIVEFKRGG